jgi:hypothetical protein
MSTNLAVAPRARQLPGDLSEDLFDAPAPRRGPIEIVTTRIQRRARPRIVYALIATAALFVLLLTQLGVSIALSQGAYQISALQNTQTSLQRTQQKYSEKLQVLSSPQNIANNATNLGMVRNANPVYLDLSTDKVYGTPTPATGDAASSHNLIPNSLLSGVKAVTKPKKASESKASASATTGAAAEKSTTAKVPSTTNQLAAPQTR